MSSLSINLLFIGLSLHPAEKIVLDEQRIKP